MSTKYMPHRRRRGKKSRPGFLDKLKALFANPKVLGGTAAGLLLAIGLSIFFLVGGKDETEETTDKRSRAEDSGGTVAALVNPADIPIPSSKLGQLTVKTPQPGFFVMINGEPARNAEGHLLRTPCQIKLERGNYDIKVARTGFTDTQTFSSVGPESEVSLYPVPITEGPQTGVLAAPYFEAEVGKPIELTSLNSVARELDPYVEPDGLTIWFVSTRPLGKGIYRAFRSSIYQPFGEPEFMPQSQGSGLPATPSITRGKWRGLVYATPTTSRVWGLTLEQAKGTELDSKIPLRFHKGAAQVWPSAQMLDDGLALYWVQNEDGNLRTYESQRQSLTREFIQAKPIAMPGVHPCLSADGLRQYLFNGRTLQRARRGSLDTPFSTPEMVAELNLPNYLPDSSRRQYFVSDDEQWLFYCDSPQQGGDLYMVRIHAGRGWGTTPIGKPIVAELPQVASVDNPKEPVEPKPELNPATPEIDPRTLPLPYLPFRKNFEKLMAEGKFPEALQLAQQALDDPKLAKDRETVQWDLEEARNAENFWDIARRAFGQLKPDEEFRIGNAKVSFEKLESDILFAKSSTKNIQKPLLEMRPVDLLSVIDQFIPETDTTAQLQIGTFLAYHPDSNLRSAQVRIDRAEAKGKEFLARRPARILHLARREIDRENTGIGLDYINKVLAKFPDTPAAKTAQQMTEELYSSTKWDLLGRPWKTNTPGEYYALLNRVDGAYMQSPRQYENFELRLEWQTDPGFSQGGVFFHYPGDGNVVEKAYKLHLANDFGIKSDLVSTGALYKLEKASRNVVKRQGEWNSLILRVSNGNITATINGNKVLTTTLLDPEKGEKGYVMLDGVVGGIRYRRVMLLELPPEKKEESQEANPFKLQLLEDEPKPEN